MCSVWTGCSTARHSVLLFAETGGAARSAHPPPPAAPPRGCRGINDFGQLGVGTTSYATTPQRVVDLEGVFLADVAAGGWHSLAISAEGGERSGHRACLGQRARGQSV